jgi:hypothetical protein
MVTGGTGSSAWRKLTMMFAASDEKIISTKPLFG